MNSRELYTLLQRHLPDLKVVFMSGYASNLFEQQSIIDHNTSFIQKPFSLSKLAKIARRTLDSG